MHGSINSGRLLRAANAKAEFVARATSLSSPFCSVGGRVLPSFHAGVERVLSFNQVPSKLVIPYSAITGFHDPAVNFELRFQAADGPDEPEPHDEAENDGGPRDDGSNVVSVDFKRKK